MSVLLEPIRIGPGGAIHFSPRFFKPGAAPPPKKHPPTTPLKLATQITKVNIRPHRLRAAVCAPLARSADRCFQRRRWPFTPDLFDDFCDFCVRTQKSEKRKSRRRFFQPFTSETTRNQGSKRAATGDGGKTFAAR
jgi:hypothetical protein